VHVMNERFILFLIVIITLVCGYILVKTLSIKCHKKSFQQHSFCIVCANIVGCLPGYEIA